MAIGKPLSEHIIKKLYVNKQSESLFEVNHAYGQGFLQGVIGIDEDPVEDSFRYRHIRKRAFYSQYRQGLIDGGRALEEHNYSQFINTDS